MSSFHQHQRVDSPVYIPPSSSGSCLPPGNATCASFDGFLSFAFHSDASVLGLDVGESRCRYRTSGRASGWFTQPSSKNSVNVGGLSGFGGKGALGAGATRMISATAALRGSGNNDISFKAHLNIGDLRVGGDVMILGGVVRMRWRALASRGTVLESLIVVSEQERAVPKLSYPDVHYSASAGAGLFICLFHATTHSKVKTVAASRSSIVGTCVQLKSQSGQTQGE